MFVVRTTVRKTYDSAGLPSTVLDPLMALVRRLRAGGLAVSTGEVIDAARALAAVDLADRRQVRSALRASMVKDARHDDVFDLAFEAVFRRPRPGSPGADDRPEGGAAQAAGGHEHGEQTDPVERLAEALLAGDEATVDELLADAVERWAGAEDGRAMEHHVQRVLRRVDLGRLYRRVLQPDPYADPLQRTLRAAEADALMEELRRRIEELVAAGLAHPWEARPHRSADSLADTPLLRAGPDELAALRSAVRPLAVRLAARLGRKTRRHGRGAVDMRRTLRRSVGSGGVPLDVILKRRHPSKPDLVVLCDVSGSTAQFAPFTLALLHAIHQEFRHVRSFVFVDGIVEVSDLLESAPGVLDPRHLLDRRGLMARDGRSDYALAFSRLLSGWPEVVTPRTTVIISGDGRSHDRPDAVPQLAELARLGRRLYWLDPEPRAEWEIGDSAMPRYAPHCTEVFEVSTLRQLVECVARIA
jgi:uncharacterized protein with von Willebrand factor type A (vWA) domain